MKKIITLIATFLLIVTCQTFLAVPAFAGNDWNIGDGRITDKVTEITLESPEVNVFLKTGTGSEILIEETSSIELSDDQKVHWQLDGTTLRIKYEDSFWNIFSFLLGDAKDADRSLTVTIPEDLALDSLEISVASADVTTDPLQSAKAEFSSASGDMNITLTGDMEEAEFDSASGNIHAALENADQVEADTSSGNISITMKTVKVADADTASGNISLSLETAEKVKADASSGNINISLKTAGQIDADTSSGDVSIGFGSSDQVRVDTASGDVSLTVPENADMTVKYSTSSGDFSSRLAMAKEGKTYISGTGAGQVSVSTASGDLNIWTAE